MNQNFNQVGRYSFKIDKVLNKDGNIDGEKLAKEQKKLCLIIILSENDPSKEDKTEFFNFLLNTSGLRAKDLSQLSIDPSIVSQWRSGRTTISKQSWELVRGVFYRYFKNNKLTTFSHLVEGQDIDALAEKIIEDAALKDVS